MKDILYKAVLKLFFSLASFGGGGASANPFDVTFTDTNGLENHGFYVTGGARSNGIGANSNLFKMSGPVLNSYQNGNNFDFRKNLNYLVTRRSNILRELKTIVRFSKILSLISDFSS